MTDFFCDLALVGAAVEENVLISIEEGRFRRIESGGQPPGSAARLRGLTLPGFANAHSHAFHRALRSRTQADRGSFWTWRDLMYTAAERLDPDNYFRLARATFAEMTLAGITSVGEFHYVHHRPNGTPYEDPNAMGEAVLAAANDAGLRITLLDTLYLHGGLDTTGHIAPSEKQRRFADSSVDAWIDRVDGLVDGPRHKVGAAIHSVRSVDPASMAAVAGWAEARQALLHAHLSEQRAENEQCQAHHGMSPTEVMREAGVLSERFCAVHATHLSPTDIALLAAAGSTVCFCPTTERDLGDGIGPSAELTSAGVPLSLGSDSHAIIDHFEECRAVELDERLRSGTRGTHSAVELLAMGTVVGQRSLGWDDAGVIEVGRRADLVTVDVDSVRTAGSTASDAIAAAVFAASAADVTNVIIDGEFVVQDRRHRCIDVVAELRESIKTVMDR